MLQITVAQTLPSINITVNDGLPSNGIKCFFKDSRGLFWIGTDAGLCCYNGSSYKTYNETNGLKYTEVWSIVEDENKNLWLSLYGNGLAKFDGKKFTYYNEKNGLVNNSIRKIHYSKKHKCLILATENGLGLFDGKYFKSFVKKTKMGKFQITGIDETSDKILITSSYCGVSKLFINNPIRSTTLDSLFYTKTSYSSYLTKNTYYTGSPDLNLGIKKFSDKKEKNIPCPIIWDFENDERNNIYCAAWNVIDPDGGLFKYSNNVLTNITQQANIKPTGLWCLYYDKETKQLWTGSINKGIYRVDLSNQKQFFEPSFFGLKEMEIQHLYNDVYNKTWIGAKNNIIILDKNLNYVRFDNATIWKKIEVFLKQKGLYSSTAKTFETYKKRNGFTCFNIVSDNEGFVWVNTTIGLICFDKKYEIRSFNFSDGGNIIFDNKDQSIFCRSFSNVYVKSNKFNLENYKELSISNPNIPKDVTKIVKNGKLIWFGSSSNGLYKYQNNQFFSLNSNGLFKEKNIKDIIVNGNGELVIGTNNGRVYIAKWKNNKLNIHHVYQPNKEIYGTSISFIEQSNGNYYIGTNKGINIIRNHKFVKLINKSEGINDIQLNDCVKDKNGDLWVATNNGLIKLNTNEFLKKENNSKNLIHVNSIKVNGVAFSKDSHLFSWESFDTPILKLDYNHNDIEISFGSYVLFNSDKNVFRYRIIGLSDIWSEFDNNGKIQLRGIPNGKYKIQIEGKNIGTGLVFQPRTFDLVITPPFWKTYWFILCCAIVILVISFIGYKKRIQIVAIREQAKGEVQKRLAETKMEALQSQMNPHFIFNAMNSIQNYIIDNNTDEALMYMGEFSKLIRQTLDNSSRQRISLADEMDYLQSYITLENMRFKNKVNIELDIDNDVDLFETDIPPMLIQPFVENVFVHAFDSQSVNPTLTLCFKLIDGFISCEIQDNGKGMVSGNLNKLHTSKGIKLAKERISLFQPDAENAVSVISVPKEGTTIVLRLQIDNL